MSWAPSMYFTTLPWTWTISVSFHLVALWSILYPWFQLHKGGIRLPVKAFPFPLSPKIQISEYDLVWRNFMIIIIIAWAEPISKLASAAHWWQMARDFPGCWNDGKRRCSPPSPGIQKVGSCDLLLASVLCDSGLCTSIASLFWEHTIQYPLERRAGKWQLQFCTEITEDIEERQNTPFYLLQTHSPW